MGRSTSSRAWKPTKPTTGNGPASQAPWLCPHPAGRAGLNVLPAVPATAGDDHTTRPRRDNSPLLGERGSRPHRRELKGFSPVRPPAHPSCHLLLTIRPYGGAGVQPRPHGGFLMPPAAWTAGEKPAQPWQARPQPRLRPRALDLLA